LESNPNSGGDPSINGVYQGQGQARSNLNTAEGLQFTIAATIVDIRPNGHLVIEAHSTVKNNDEIWDQSLSGIVSPERVNANGEVQSEEIAELMINKEERGQVRDGYRRGWMYWLLDKYGMF
jgi:flagellar L-ring protein precursor FlgH